MTIEAVFLDRDGVLNPHIPGGYLLSASDVTLLPGVAHAIRHLNDAGLKVIVISNQQGVGKGLMTVSDLAAIQQRMAELLMHEAGAHLDRCYYSTELASENSPRRKPGPGMLLEAAYDYGLTLAHTLFAGDSPTDIAAGHAAGVGQTVLLLSGGIAAYAPDDFSPAPDLVFTDLGALADWVLEQKQMIKATAPGRCGIVGNPTDMYGGSVLSLSTRERASCTLTDAAEMQITVSGQTQLLHTTDDLTLRPGDYLNVARTALSALEINPATDAPFHLSAATEIPMQAGLAGSTAILACLTGTLLAHLGLRLSPYEMAELVRKIEYDVLGIVCGFQDAYMTVFGGLNFMDFTGRSSTEALDLTTPFGAVEPLAPYVRDFPFVLAHTGVRHHSGSVHASPRERWLAGDPAAVSGYAEIASMSRTAKRALLSGDCDTLARLMTRNHAVVRDLGGSGDANETLIAAALDGGASAAKLAGAGGGGTILALTLDPDRTALALQSAGAEAILFPVPTPGLTVEMVS